MRSNIIGVDGNAKLPTALLGLKVGLGPEAKTVGNSSFSVSSDVGTAHFRLRSRTPILFLRLMPVSG